MKAFAIVLGAFSTMAISAPSLSGWAGTWRLDRLASRFRGDITHIVGTPEGYRFDLGPVSFVLPDDGAFHPTVAGRETRLARLGANRWAREHRVNGRVVDRSMLSISADSRTLTIAGEHPGAAPERLVREGAGFGLAGPWRSTRLGINAADMLTIADLGAKRLRWGSPADGNWYDVTVDGPPAVNKGPTANPTATLKVGTARDGTLRWTERVDGKAYRFGIEQRSSDGDTLTEIAWPAGVAVERQMLVYRRDRTKA